MKLLFLLKMILGKIKFMIFDVFYVSFIFEKYKMGNVFFFKVFWIGLYLNFRVWKIKEYFFLIYVFKKVK